jgi:hypothetical protein
VERAECVRHSGRQRLSFAQGRQATLAILPWLMTLGITCTPRAQVRETSKCDVLASPGAKAAARIEVYYADWRAFRMPIEEEALRDNMWEYKVIVRFPNLDLDRLRNALATTKAQPLNTTPHGFVLACTIELVGERGCHETLLLSFAMYPGSVRLNGGYFKPSEELLLLMSEFLPCEAGKTWMEMEPVLEGKKGT